MMYPTGRDIVTFGARSRFAMVHPDSTEVMFGPPSTILRIRGGFWNTPQRQRSGCCGSESYDSEQRGYVTLRYLMRMELPVFIIA